jgi:hypothetical protein
MHMRVRRSTWAFIRLAFAAAAAASGFAYMIGQMMPTSAIAG